MSEAPTPAPPAPTSVPTLPESPPRQRSGCASPMTVGCGLVLLLLLVGSAVVISKGSSLFRWGLERTRATVLTGLGPEVTAAERARLDAAFTAVADAVSAGEVDHRGMERLRQDLREALDRVRDGAFGRQDAVALSERLEEIAGGRREGRRIPPDVVKRRVAA